MAYEETLYEILEDYMGQDKRTLQRRIGPSGLGNTCWHCLAAALAELPKQESVADHWLAFIGKAVHYQAERAVKARNRKLGYNRFLSEHPVWVGNVGDIKVTGSLDLFDTDERVVSDFKVVGDATLREVIKGNCPTTYLKQIDLYGLGLEHEGYAPERTCILFLPRNRFRMRDGIAVVRPWDRDNAMETLRQANDIWKLLQEHGPEYLIPRLKRAPGCYDCKRYLI